MAGLGQKFLVPAGEGDGVGSARGVHDLESVPVGQLAGQAALARAVTALQGDGVVAGGQGGDVHDASPDVTPVRVVAWPVLAYCTIRFRQLGSRPWAWV